MKHLRKTLIGLGIAASVAGIGSAIADSDAFNKPTISPKAMADALHLVMDSDRTIYTKKLSTAW